MTHGIVRISAFFENGRAQLRSAVNIPGPNAYEHRKNACDTEKRAFPRILTGQFKAYCLGVCTCRRACHVRDTRQVGYVVSSVKRS